MATTSQHGLPNPQDFWTRFVQPRIAHIQSVSPLDSTNIVRDARQTLDDELAAMHLAMCNLRTRRNTLSPVSSLPVEVLAHVFQIIVTVSSPLERSRPGHGWIPAMTHVCRHWRDTALLHPSLWGNINLDLTLPWRRLMMARAKFAPLAINLSYYDSEESAFVTEHAFHTRELGLAAPQIDLQETCQSLTSPAVMLESLELHSTGEAVMLPTNIFAGNTPSLRRITLQRVLFSWSGPIFRNLTHLQVSASDNVAVPFTSEGSHVVSTDPALQYDQLFDALARMPALQTLNLAHCIPSILHHNAYRLPLNLPCLGLLSLAGMLTVCSNVLQHLTIPASCSVVLKCDTGGPQPIDGLVRFFNRHTVGRAVPSLRTLVISRILPYTIYTVCMDLWCTYDTGDEPNGEPFISVHFPSSPSDLQSLESLCSLLPLDDLRVLKASLSYDGWSSETWINMFGRCRTVEHVSVKGRNVVHFCRALIRPWDRSAGSSRTAEQLFFRHLKSLEVSNADLLAFIEDDGRQTPFNVLFADWLFERRDLMDDDENLGKSGTNGRDSIVPSENVAKDVDNRLERLQIKRCSITREYVRRLGQVIQNIVWDHDEGIYMRDRDESEESEEEDSVYNI